MTLNWQNVGIKKLAAIISEYLQKNDIEVVFLTGTISYLYSLPFAIHLPICLHLILWAQLQRLGITS
jgi:hypothetical protein